MHQATIKVISVIVAACILQACKKPATQAESKTIAEQPATEVQLKASAEQQNDDKNKALCISETLAQLKDPDSAKITDMFKTGPVSVELVGGAMAMRLIYEYNVNAKNSYGGYTGREQWRCIFVPETNEYKGAYRRP